MEVLSEYINYVPLTNLCHLWAGVVVLVLIMIFSLYKEWSALSVFSIIAALVTGGCAVVYSVEQPAYIERVGYINDPAAFVEMLDDWELIEQQDQLMVLRRMEPMTDDEVKEWKGK